MFASYEEEPAHVLELWPHRILHKAESLQYGGWWAVTGWREHIARSRGSGHSGWLAANWVTHWQIAWYRADRLIAWFDSHTHAQACTHIFRNWVIPRGPQASDRFTSKRQNILSDMETGIGKWQAYLIKLTHRLTGKTHSVDCTDILAYWQNSLFIIY